MLRERDSNLFSTYDIKGLTLRNRFVMPGMQRGFASDGKPTPKMIDYLRSCAAGGAGLIISEATQPDHPSAYWQPVLCEMSHRTAAVWGDVITAVKSEGARFLLQLAHPGAVRVVAPGDRYHDVPALSASGLVQSGRTNGRAMTRTDMSEVSDAYVQAAVQAKMLGADGVEFHGAHGYFFDQFLWAETNVRTDVYGGVSLSQRARYPAEVIAAVRKAVGDDFVISFRFSQFKEADYNARIAETPEELEGFLTLLRAAGVDCFNVSTRRYYTPEWPDLHPHRTLAGWTKLLTDATVIAVGSVGLEMDAFSDLSEGQNPELRNGQSPKPRVEQDLIDLIARLDDGDFDLIAVGRAHIANNDFVALVREKRFSEMKVFDKRVHVSEFSDKFNRLLSPFQM